MAAPRPWPRWTASEAWPAEGGGGYDISDSNNHRVRRVAAPAIGVPSVSHWGVTAIALLLLTTGAGITRNRMPIAQDR